MSAIFVAQIMTFVASLSTLITGLIFIINILDDSELCNPDIPDINCLGSSLIIPDDDNFVEDVNRAFRAIFTLDPNVFLVIWAPLMMGIMSTYIHFDSDIFWSFIFDSWFRASMWYLFIALFGNFGYAGNWGILSGFFCAIASFLCLIVEFGGHNGNPPFLSINISCGVGEALSGPFFHGFITFLMIVSAALTFVIGCMHLVERIPNPCDDDIDGVECVGPSLFWNGEDVDFLQNSNIRGDGWSSLFSLAPGAIAENFTPFVLGAIALSATVFDGNYFYFIISSASRILWWHLIVAIFANFGYQGTLGILTGFISSTTALMAFLLVFMGGEGGYGLSAFGAGLSFGGGFGRGGGGGGGTAGGNNGNYPWANRKPADLEDVGAPPPNNRTNTYGQNSNSNTGVDSGSNKGWFTWGGNNNNNSSNNTFADSRDSTPTSTNSYSQANRGNTGYSGGNNSSSGGNNSSSGGTLSSFGKPAWTSRKDNRDESSYTNSAQGQMKGNYRDKPGTFESDGKVMAGAGKREVEAMFGKNRQNLDGGNSHSSSNNGGQDTRPGASKTVDRGPNSKYGILAAANKWNT